MDVNAGNNIDLDDATPTPETKSEALAVSEDERRALFDSRAPRQA